MRFKPGGIGAICLALALCAFDAAASADKERLAERAAGKWLALVDAGEYDTAWERAASLFKMQVSRGQWRAAAAAARKPLGSMSGRRLITANYVTSLPGAPDGEYVVLQYRSEFENKKSAIETVTPMLDRDGSWRVSGYYVR